MLTFTISLGLGGLMQYLPGYQSATFGDFYNIRVGNSNCSWGTSGQICNWPVPPLNDNDDPAKLDDLGQTRSQRPRSLYQRERCPEPV